MRILKSILLIAFFVHAAEVKAQLKTHFSIDLSNTVMKLWPDSMLLGSDKAAKWRYDQGVILKGMEAVWQATGDGKWFKYIQKCMDLYIQEDGSIRGYRPDEYNIDHINNGKSVLFLYQVTGKAKYKKAADLLRNQLRTHPRTKEGSFWHKKIYPWQVWLDGLYMGQPFYAEYAKLFHEDTAFNDIARQFIYIEKNARDPKTGLLYHGWDESREQKWADKKTGLSPNFWGRALGWFGMAMVDVLDHFPEKHWGRDSIIAILKRFSNAVIRYQDPSGLWFDVVDKKNEKKNYFEASASSMLVYTLAKGVRKGYLPLNHMQYALKGYNGIVTQFVVDESGQIDLHGTVAVSGLGGNPYRDGSFEYYMSEPVIVNDPKGMGAFIKCAAELELSRGSAIGKGKTIVLDRYFNSEKRKDAVGVSNYWHYTWEEKSDPGFSTWGWLFAKHGASLSSLDAAPDMNNLKNASVYIIVDPDHLKDNPAPNYVNEKDIKSISEWVKAGGVLVLMANDSANCELVHFNSLASVFGINFIYANRNMVKNDQYETGAVWPGTDKNATVFTHPKKMFLKDICVIKTNSPGRSLITKDNDVIMATAKYGKGTVFAVGDPWLYNEYVDGRRLPSEFENFKAAEDLVVWLLGQTKK